MTFVRDKNNLAENYLEYYFANPDNVKFGVGCTNIRNIKLGPVILLPINIFWGWEIKYFNKEGTDGLLHLNIQVGLRSVFKVKDFVVGPEFIYSFGVLRNQHIMQNPNHIRFGVNTRWKFIHGGVFKSIGYEIDFLGDRVGATF